MGTDNSSLCKTVSHAYGQKGELPSEMISCATYAMHILVMQISGISVMEDINNQFLLMNNAGASFGMLSSIKSIYENIDWSILPVDSTYQGSGFWETKLFRDSPEEFYWVQLDLKKSLPIAAKHVCVVHILKIGNNALTPNKDL